MSPGAFADVNAACGMFTTCVNTPTYTGTSVCTTNVYGSTLVCGGDVCAGDDVIAGGDICAVSGILIASKLNIGGSSACESYVSGNSYGTGSICSGCCVASSIGCFSCTYACRRLRLPVGTNCY
jgi:hypothetical protein